MDCRPERNAFFTNELQDALFPCSGRFHEPGISLWKVGKTRGRQLDGREHAHRPVPRASQAATLLRIEVVDLLERREDSLLEQLRSRVRIDVGSALRLGDDCVRHPELEAVERVRLER